MVRGSLGALGGGLPPIAGSRSFNAGSLVAPGALFDAGPVVDARTVVGAGPVVGAEVEPLGAHYYDNVHLLDARARKDFRYRNHRLALGVDVFNLLNVNTVTSITTRSGATYGLTTTAAGNTTTLPFMPGRNVQFTLNYTF